MSDFNIIGVRKMLNDLHLVFNLYSTNSFTELQIPFEDSLCTSEMHKKLLDIGAFWNSILIKRLLIVQTRGTSFSD
jgi:hypothetical protein